MTIDTPPGRLTSGAKAALLDAMRKAPVGDRAAPAPAQRAHQHDMAFETLPAYQHLRSQRALADAVGIDFPFYRPHDARAGAQSVIAGQQVVNFASYDYLGLNGHPEITRAVADAAGQWGTSVSASRITAGERGFHRELEAGAGRYLRGGGVALVFVSGHATAVSTIAALLGPKDLILHDALIHNCVVVGAQLMRRDAAVLCP